MKIGNLDLDDEEATQPIEDTDVPTKRSEIEAAPGVIQLPKKLPVGEDTMLPIRCTDEAGNIVYRQRALDAMTGDEFLSWVYDVLPVDEQSINKLIRLRDGQKLEKGVQKLSVRKEIFTLVVHMHEEKWLFLKGRDRHPDYAKWN